MTPVYAERQRFYATAKTSEGEGGETNVAFPSVPDFSVDEEHPTHKGVSEDRHSLSVKAGEVVVFVDRYAMYVAEGHPRAFLGASKLQGSWRKAQPTD